MLQRTLLAFATVIACAGVNAHDKPESSTAARGVAAAVKANGSGIALRYDMPARIELNAPAMLTLRLSGVVADGASVEVRAPSGLTVTPSAGTVALPRGAETTLTLSVTPTAHGVHYLDVFTRQNGRISAHSIAVGTGAAATRQLKRAGNAQTTPAGERIVSLPAQ